MGTIENVGYNFHCLTPYFVHFATHALCNSSTLLDRTAGRTSWTDQLDGTAGRTSSFYLKPWPVRIFEDFPFSLYIVAASESDKGLVIYKSENYKMSEEYK